MAISPEDLQKSIDALNKTLENVGEISESFATSIENLRKGRGRLPNTITALTNRIYGLLSVQTITVRSLTSLNTEAKRAATMARSLTDIQERAVNISEGLGGSIFQLASEMDILSAGLGENNLGLRRVVAEARITGQNQQALINAAGLLSGKLGLSVIKSGNLISEMRDLGASFGRNMQMLTETIMMLADDMSVLTAIGGSGPTFLKAVQSVADELGPELGSQFLSVMSRALRDPQQLAILQAQGAPIDALSRALVSTDLGSAIGDIKKLFTTMADSSVLQNIFGGTGAIGFGMALQSNLTVLPAQMGALGKILKDSSRIINKGVTNNSNTIQDFETSLTKFYGIFSNQFMPHFNTLISLFQITVPILSALVLRMQLNAATDAAAKVGVLGLLARIATPFAWLATGAAAIYSLFSLVSEGSESQKQTAINTKKLVDIAEETKAPIQVPRMNELIQELTAAKFKRLPSSARLEELLEKTNTHLRNVDIGIKNINQKTVKPSLGNRVP